MYSAIDIWNWSWVSALLLFFGPLIVVISIALAQMWSEQA